MTENEALEEIQLYRMHEKRLCDIFVGELSLAECVDELERALSEPDKPHPVNARILTYEDADMWESYKAIGTVEECWEAVEIRKKKKPVYEGDGYDPEGKFVWDEWLCPNCDARYEVDYYDYDYCPNCGQAIDRSGEE